MTYVKIINSADQTTELGILSIKEESFDQFEKEYKKYKKKYSNEDWEHFTAWCEEQDWFEDFIYCDDEVYF